MEYIVLWILALFGLWSLVSNILESFYIANNSGVFDVVLTVCNQEDTIECLVNELSRIDLVGKIRVVDNNSTDNTVRILEEMQKKGNCKVFIE